MSIDIVPVIDNYITQFLSLDKSIPRMCTETVTLISEYLKTTIKVSLYDKLLKILYTLECLNIK